MHLFLKIRLPTADDGICVTSDSLCDLPQWRVYFKQWNPSSELVLVPFQLQCPVATLCPPLFVWNQTHQRALLFKNKTSFYLPLFTSVLCCLQGHGDFSWERELSGQSRTFRNSCAPFLLRTLFSGLPQEMLCPTEQILEHPGPRHPCVAPKRCSGGDLSGSEYGTCAISELPPSRVGFVFSISHFKALKSEFWPHCSWSRGRVEG